MKTNFGILKELKEGETRVALTPDSVGMLTQEGLSVAIESGAGSLSGFDDIQYEKAGAKVVQSAQEIWEKSSVIVKVKEPQKSEFKYFREDLVIFSYLHLAVEEELAKELLKKKVCAIAAEAVETQWGELPLLRPMSEVAGRMSIQLGARFLEKQNGGRGLLLGGVPGVAPAKVVILGGGVAGSNAAQAALGMGADVSVLDVNSKRLSNLDMFFGGQIKTYYSNYSTIASHVQEADLLITAVLIPSARAPKLVSAQMVKSMKKGSAIIDIAIDQGGNVETIDRVTTLDNPIFEKYEVLHCAVPNIPSYVPKTSSYAYSYAILPFLKELGEKGTFVALKENEALCAGVSTFRGAVTNEALAQSVGCEHTEISLLIGFKVK